jgi:diguanylate cyclase (GGDEF)-like protein/PAS domain S-box-containing protein
MSVKPIVILLIEDDPDYAVLIQRSLSEAMKIPYHLNHVDRLQKGLACLKSGGIDVVIMDLSLPDGHGLETFDQVHSLSPNVPVIVLTGHDDDDFALEAVHKGAQDYLVKGPAAGSLLQRSIRYAIERNKLFTELKQAEEALRAGEAKLRNITSVIGQGIYVLDKEGRLTFMNPEAEKLLGWTEAELLGKEVNKVIHFLNKDGTRLPAAECPEIKTITFGGIYRDEESLFSRKDGTLFPAAVVATPLRENEEIIGSVAAFQDITERKNAAEELKRLNELLEHQATTDPLTGISNRLKFSDTLNAEIRRSKRYSLPLSLIMFDIDHFKGINDTYGHLAGDGVLRELVHLAAANVRLNDLLARWGGEEFMLMVTNSALDHAGTVAEKLRTMFEHHYFSGVGRVTCSFGVSQFGSNENEDLFIKRVDDALYRAKDRGRNRVEIA